MSYATKQEIEELLRRKSVNREAYSGDEIELLRRYEGGGGIKGAKGRGVIDEFYTPWYIAALMWKLAKAHGYPDDRPVLEPSCGPGRFFADAPEDAELYGFEINPFSYQIAQILYPRATVYPQYFETAFLEPDRYTTRIRGKVPTWLPGYPFGLIIGNPPYGVYKNQYSGYFKNPPMYQIENFFMYYGMHLLAPGGLIVYLTSSNFLRNGQKYNSVKEALSKYGTLLDALRLSPVFSNSKVPVDILIFRKRHD